MGVTFEAQAPSGGAEPALKPTNPSRPNFNKLHAQPLPIKTYPLPPLIPHNPLSIFQIAFTYLYQIILPPPSHQERPLCGYFSAETCSVHITDQATVRILWEQGFFGKGNLSRSEPAWLEREKIRQGLLIGDTSEEITRKRREERKEFKHERARREREAIEEKLAEEAGGTTLPVGAGKSGSEEPNGYLGPATADQDTSGNALLPGASERNVSLSDNASLGLGLLDGVSEGSSKIIVNQEHLQLTLEEAFFLTFGLGILGIQDPSTSQKISPSKLFSICRSYSYFPPQSRLSPDDPFLLSYVVYHHFRSLGWVIRPGIKFAVDYLLYNRGPVFSHAEFAVNILPSYSHAYWDSTPELRAAVKRKEKKSWWWLHCVNRVQAQVKKSLVVVYVEVPPPMDLEEEVVDNGGDVIDITRFLRRYRVRELMVKRWTPNRSR
ncbi:MAG: hypothetical protein Q9170_007004 [Blastenia crenularia]